mmetsp:Transcript_49769/g.131947  ORF Transcript_49769/g.131947 Transcript_49769/m.131947 type:complete len:379 (+) Transcript_49769:604-1740(+)
MVPGERCNREDRLIILSPRCQDYPGISHMRHEKPRLSVFVPKMLLLGCSTDVEDESKGSSCATRLRVEWLLQEAHLRLVKGLAHCVFRLHQESVLAKQALWKRTPSEGRTMVACWPMAIKDAVECNMAIVGEGVPRNKEVVLVWNASVQATASRTHASDSPGPSALHGVIGEARDELWCEVHLFPCIVLPLDDKLPRALHTSHGLDSSVVSCGLPLRLFHLQIRLHSMLQSSGTVAPRTTARTAAGNASLTRRRLLLRCKVVMMNVPWRRTPSLPLWGGGMPFELAGTGGFFLQLALQLLHRQLQPLRATDLLVSLRACLLHLPLKQQHKTPSLAQLILQPLILVLRLVELALQPGLVSTWTTGSSVAFSASKVSCRT